MHAELSLDDCIPPNEIVATITFEFDFLGALVSMLAYSIAIVVCPHDFRAA
jgi:hypothetical protein